MEKLDPWLEDTLVQLALYRQGTCAEDVRTVAFAHWREDAASVVEQRYARQLLAQVSWEMALCTESMQGLPPSAMAVPQPIYIGKQALASPRVPSAKRPERPVSASESRWRESRDRCLQLAEARSQQRRCQWDEKERALAGVRQLREQRVDEARQRARQRNRLVDEQREAAKRAQAQQREDMSRELEDSRRAEEERFAELRVREKESAFALVSAQAQRMAAQEANRRRMSEEREAQQKEQLKRSEQAIAEAQRRKAKTLRARSTGPSSLRTNRELASKRVARTARIKEVEREAARQRLENLQPVQKTVFTVPSVPRKLEQPCSMSGSGVGACTDDEPESEASAQQERLPTTSLDRPLLDRVPWPRVAVNVGAKGGDERSSTVVPIDTCPILKPGFDSAAGGAAELQNHSTDRPIGCDSSNRNNVDAVSPGNSGPSDAVTGQSQEKLGRNCSEGACDVQDNLEEPPLQVRRLKGLFTILWRESECDDP